MARRDLQRWEALLVRKGQGRFGEAEVAGLPESASRHLRRVIADGTPMAQSARITMQGRIKIGRWIPFRAHEVLTPHVGFVWAARAAGIISGSDRYLDGRGGMDWKLAGLIRVIQADGPDVSRSAAERAAAEAVWVPTSLLPRFGVEWLETDATSLSARYAIDGRPVAVDYTLAGDGLVESVTFERWGDPDGGGEFALHPFGGEFTAHATFGGVTIPSEGSLGWFYGTERWSEGEFFRYRITELELL